MLFPQSVHCFLIFLFYQKSHFYLRKSHISIFADTRVWTGDDGENRTYESEATLCPTVSAWPSKHLFTKQFLFLLHLPSFPLKSKITIPNILLQLQLKMVFKVGASTILAS